VKPLRRTRLAATALVAFALLWAQTLGLLHGIVHAPHSAATAAVQAIADSGAAVAPPEVRAGIDRLFGEHGEHTPACHLYDQLTHAQAMASAVAAFVVTAHCDAPPPVRPARVRAAAPVPFLARAPPAHA
jgi:hypothetical protein